MKKIYRPLLKGTNWALSGLLSLIGGIAVSCEGDPISGDENRMVEYGTPYAEYAIKGKVTDTKGTPIPGIEVKAGTKYDRAWMQERPATYPYKTTTNAQGEYDFRLGTVGAQDFTVYAEDIDGEVNGLFKTDSTAVAGSKMKLTGGDNRWNMGKTETTVNFALKEEKQAGE